MTLRLFAIRPEPGFVATQETAVGMGLEVHGTPLFAIEPIAWTPPSQDSVEGLLLGSANAIRHGGSELANFLDSPVYAVGSTTAELAERTGFTIAKIGEGGLQRLLDELDNRPLRLLRIAGEDHVKLEPPPQIRIELRIVYRSVAKPIPDTMAEQLQQGGVILLHSATAARHFAAECHRHDIPRAGLSLAALGPRIARAAGAGWKAMRSAPQPTEAALLALAGDMCH